MKNHFLFFYKIILQLSIIFLFKIIVTKHHALALKKRPARRAQYLKIKTKNFDIIFEKKFLHEANRIANRLNHYFGHISNSLNAPSYRIPVRIMSRNMELNSVAMMNPPMVNLYTTFPQIREINGVTNWIDLLCLHEFRHVVQNNLSYNYGFGKYIYSMFGTPVPWARLPSWLYEGDSIVTETVFSNGGRGRIPEFLMLYKANILERNFKYDKLLFNSLKDKVTDHYPLGYHLTVFLRKKYGKNIIEKLHKKASSFPYLFLPFDMIVKHTTGKYTNEIYKDAVKDLRQIWKKQLKNLKITPALSYNKPNRQFTNYYFPHELQDGKIIALKYGISHLPTLVILNSNKEILLKEVGKIDVSKLFSVSKNKVTWSEDIRHPRWQHIEYSVIKVYDIKSSTTNTITYKTRFRAPSLSIDAKKIVTVETDDKYRHSLVIIDAVCGRVIKKFDNLYNDRYIMPKWVENDKKILVIKCRENLNSLVLFDVDDGTEEYIISYTSEYINNPFLYKNYILYNSPYNGIQNIYAFDRNTKKVYQVTSRKYGAFNAFVSKNGKSIIYNDFTKDGMDVVKMNFYPQSWTPIEDVEIRDIKYYLPIIEQENPTNLLDTLPKKKHKIYKYSSFKNLMNIYSINFWPLDLETSHKPCARFFISAKDPLDTYDFKLSYKYFYDFSKDFFKFSNHFAIIDLDYTYKKFFPELNIRADKKINSGYKNDSLQEPYPNILIKSKFTLPFVLNIGSSYKQTINYGMQYDFKWQYKNNEFFKVAFKPVIFIFRNIKMKTHRDIAPRWGQTFVYIKRCPANKFGDQIEYNKSIDSFGLQLYFPGILRHDSFQFISVFNNDHGNEYLLGSKFLLPYEILIKNESFAYNPKYYRNKISSKILSLYLTYDMPLWYPDFRIGPLVYFYQMRLKAIFSSYIDFDLKKGWHVPHFDSAGAALLFDFKAFRIDDIKFTVGFLLMYTKENRFISSKPYKNFPFPIIPYPIIEMSTGLN